MPTISQPKGPFKRPARAKFGEILRLRGSGSFDTAKFHNGTTDRIMADRADQDDYVAAVAREANIRAQAAIQRQKELAAEVCAQLMLAGVQPWHKIW
jgi:hypothetical protein